MLSESAFSDESSSLKCGKIKLINDQLINP
jgi:hypothetical protein